MTGSEFQRRVGDALQPHSEALTNLLRKLIKHEYPAEVITVDFEVFTDGFTDSFPVRGFFLDEFDTEFFLYRNGNAEYPSPVDPGLLDLPQVYDASLEQELAESDEDADIFTLAGLALIPWFDECWSVAGGRQFSRNATIRLHDDDAAYNLVKQEWCSD